MWISQLLVESIRQMKEFTQPSAGRGLISIVIQEVDSDSRTG
jgi:hypothetical protein